MSTTAAGGRPSPPRRASEIPDHEHEHDHEHRDHTHGARDRPDTRDRDRDRDDDRDDPHREPYDGEDDDGEDDGPYERSTIADVREAAKVPIRHIFRRFWPDTRPFRGRMLLSLALVGVGPALGTVNIYLFKILVDDVLTPHDFRLFPLIAGAFLAITVIGGLINFADEYMTAWVGEKFVMAVRQRVFDHLHRLSSGYFETRQLGDLLSRLTGDVSSIEQLMLTGVNMALTYSFQIVFYAGAMFVLNWQLALAALVAAPFFLLVARVFAKRIQSAARESRRRAGSISAVAEESFGNVALVQAYDRAADEGRRFRDQNLGNFRAQMRAIKIEGMFSPISALVESIGTLVVIGIGVWELSQNRITLGGLLVFLAYITQLYGPVQGFAGLTNSIFAASASAERIIEVLDEKPLVEDPAEPVRIGRATGRIALQGVSFAYPGTDRQVLSHLDLTIAPGRKVAVVGASGAGKSTLTKLLMRTYDPDQGTVSLDGVDIRRLRLAGLRRNITVVLQETLVFDGSIADNIRWGRPDATDEDVATAAAAADAHDFITRLPDGYDTRIGQRGRMLSGGQRQRIAIARAMIRDAPVLLLDEPTTGLDAESSRRVLEPLRRLMTGRTTVIISHNLVTVTDADEILFVEHGEITARGTHEELLDRSEGYAHLYELHHPEAAQSGLGQGGAGQGAGRGAAGPGTARPGTARPGTARPGTARPGTAGPGTAGRGATVAPAPPLPAIAAPVPAIGAPVPAAAASVSAIAAAEETVLVPIRSAARPGTPTDPVPVPFVRPRPVAEPAPAAERRFVALPLAARTTGPGAPQPPDHDRGQAAPRLLPAERSAVFAAAASGAPRPRPSHVEDTSLLSPDGRPRSGGAGNGENPAEATRAVTSRSRTPGPRSAGVDAGDRRGEEPGFPVGDGRRAPAAGAVPNETRPGAPRSVRSDGPGHRGRSAENNGHNGFAPDGRPAPPPRGPLGAGGQVGHRGGSRRPGDTRHDGAAHDGPVPDGRPASRPGAPAPDRSARRVNGHDHGVRSDNGTAPDRRDGRDPAHDDSAARRINGHPRGFRSDNGTGPDRPSPRRDGRPDRAAHVDDRTPGEARRYDRTGADRRAGDQRSGRSRRALDGHRADDVDWPGPRPTSVGFGEPRRGPADQARPTGLRADRAGRPADDAPARTDRLAATGDDRAGDCPVGTARPDRGRFDAGRTDDRPGGGTAVAARRVDRDGGQDRPGVAHADRGRHDAARVDDRPGDGTGFAALRDGGRSHDRPIDPGRVDDRPIDPIRVDGRPAGDGRGAGPVAANPVAANPVNGTRTNGTRLDADRADGGRAHDDRAHGDRVNGRPVGGLQARGRGTADRPVDSRHPDDHEVGAGTGRDARPTRHRARTTADPADHLTRSRHAEESGDHARPPRHTRPDPERAGTPARRRRAADAPSRTGRPRDEQDPETTAFPATGARRPSSNDPGTSEGRRARHSGDGPRRGRSRGRAEGADHLRRPDPGRHAVPDLDEPTRALPLAHLTQAFEKLTVPDPRVPEDDADLDPETTAFRAIPRPRRRSLLTGELPKVPPAPRRRR